MRLIILGKYGPYQRVDSACSSYLISDDETRILLDCGSGSFTRLRWCFLPEYVNAVFISHYHWDHFSDLGVYGYYIQKNGGKSIPLYSVDTDLPLPKEFSFNKIVHNQVITVGSLKLTFFNVKHTVPCMGVRIENSKGECIVYTGDTCYFEGLAEHCKGADILLADVCYPDSSYEEQPTHMCSQDAGRLAKEAGVKLLLCTHTFSDLQYEDKLLNNTGFHETRVAMECYEYRT